MLIPSFKMPNHSGALMFQALLGAGGLANATALAYHPYFQRPEGDDGDNNPHDFLDTANYVNSGLKAATGAQVWAGETGWFGAQQRALQLKHVLTYRIAIIRSTYAGVVQEQPLITEEQQADYLVRRMVLLAATNFDRIFLFAAFDFPDNLTGSARGPQWLSCALSYLSRLTSLVQMRNME